MNPSYSEIANIKAKKKPSVANAMQEIKSFKNEFYLAWLGNNFSRLCEARHLLPSKQTELYYVHLL